MFAFPFAIKTFAVVQVRDEIKDEPSIQMRKFQIDPKIIDTSEKRCERITQRVSEKIAKYKENENRHQGIYLGLENKLTNLITHLEEKGYEGKQLQSLRDDLEKLKKLEEDFKTAYTDYRVKLELAKTSSCGDSEQNFTDTLKEVKLSLAEVRTTIDNIKNFYHDTIKPDIAAMREFIQSKNSSESEDATEE